jgi:hypothetical protein
MDKIKEKVSNWLTYFKDHIQSFNVIAKEKNYVYFSKFALESEEFYQIHNFVVTLKFNIVRDLLDQFKYCVHHIISFADKTLSERDKIMTIYSALYLNYFKKFIYDTTNKFEDFYDNSFSCLVKEFNIEIKDLKSFQVLCFCFYNKMKEQIINLNYETKIKPLKHTYNAKINNNKFDKEIKNKFFNNENNKNIQTNQNNENNIINNINEEGLRVKNKAINYVISAKEKIVDIIYEIKYRNFLPNFLSNKDEVNNINNTLSQLSNMSAQNFEHLTKILEKEKLKSDEYLDTNDINMSLSDDLTSSGINESLNNSINLNLNQSLNKINEISLTDTFKNNMNFISSINNKSINSNDINNINNFNVNNKNNNNDNINKINFINYNNKIQNPNNINSNNNLNNNNQSKIFKPNIIINTPQNKDNMYSHRLIDEIIKNKIDDKTMENIMKMAKIIDNQYLDFFLNNFNKPILILDYFACHIAHFTPEMLKDIDNDIAKNLGNVNIKFIILAKELYNTTMELFCSIYDLTSTNLNRFNRFIELAKVCGIHVQYAHELYKFFKDYSIMLLEGDAFKDLRKTVDKFIEMEKLNWEKVIDSQNSNISSF